MKLKMTVACFGLFASTPSLAWGPIGHEIVAEIAEAILAEQDALDGQGRVGRLNEIVTSGGCVDENIPAKEFAKEEFGGPKTSPFVQSATWLDDARARFKNDKNNLFSTSGGWHFVNLPMGAKPDAMNYQDVCDGGKCAVDVIQKAQNLLFVSRATTTLSAEQLLNRCRALKTLTHVVGDMHQPLHAIDFGGDRGGNSRSVKFLDLPKVTNLHSIWDGGILERHMRDRNLLVKSIAGELVGELEAATVQNTKAPAMTPAQMLSRTIDEWAWEAHAFGEAAYHDEDGNRDLPAIPAPPSKSPAPAFVVGPKYMEEAVPIVREQLKRAGVRLADLLSKSI